MKPAAAPVNTATDVSEKMGVVGANATTDDSKKMEIVGATVSVSDAPNCKPLQVLRVRCVLFLFLFFLAFVCL